MDLKTALDELLALPENRGLSASALKTVLKDDYGLSVPLDRVKKELSERNAIVTVMGSRAGLSKANHERRITESVPNALHHIDLLHLPEDGNKRYMVSIVDAASRYKAGIPISSKTPEAVVQAIRKAYGRTLLDFPDRVHVDAGTEFQGAFAKYMKKKGVSLEVGKPGDHKFTALAESLNSIVAKRLFGAQHHTERETGAVSKEWVALLPKILERINKTRNPAIKKRPVDAIQQEQVEPPGPSASTQKIIDTETILKIGSKARAPLDRPSGHGIKGTQAFRATDITYSEPKLITNLRMLAGRPVEYELEGMPGRWWVAKQLKPV